MLRNFELFQVNSWTKSVCETFFSKQAFEAMKL